MMIHLSNEFSKHLSSAGPDGTRPTGAKGTSVTPGGPNAYGSYADLGVTNPDDDAYVLELVCASVNVAAENRMIMLDVGADPAGGTAFSSIWTDILMGSPSTPLTGQLSYMRIPLRIKAGTGLGVKASSLNATVTAIRVWVNLACRPTRPEIVRAGSFVRTFGVATPGTVAGTTITPGTTSDGSYVEVGTLAEPLWYFHAGYSIDDTTMSTGQIDVDIALGDATNKRVIIANTHLWTTANELLVWNADGRHANGATGDKIYARAQHSTNPDSSNSVAVYGVGG